MPRSQVEALTSGLQDEPSRELDYELWHVGHIVTNARVRLAEFQAALGDTQLELRRLDHDHKNLQALYDVKSDGLVQAWGEYDRLSEALQEETSKNQQLSDLLAQRTHDFQVEASLREVSESIQVQHEMSIAEYQQTVDEKELAIKTLEEDRARYIAIVACLQEQMGSMEQLEAKPPGSRDTLPTGPAHHDPSDDGATSDISTVRKRQNKRRKTRH